MSVGLTTKYGMFAAFLSAVLVCGCHSRTRLTTQAAQRHHQPVAADLRSVPVPPQLQPELVRPHDGEAAARAMLLLDAVTTALSPPDYLAPRTAKASDDRDQSEHDEAPPLAAQRAHLAGRQKWLDGNAFDAITQLERAAALAPRSAEVARLLGQIYTETSNDVQAALYFEKAVRLDPADVDSLFMLGQQAIRQQQWDHAIFVFAHTLSFEASRSDVDSAIWPLSNYYLATALGHAGYDQAVVDHYQRFLASPTRLLRSSRFARDLYLLRRRRADHWQAIGDAQHRLGRPAEALDAYQQASEAQPRDPTPLLSRLVYTFLRLGQNFRARQIVVEWLSRSQADQQADQQAVQLVKYLQDQGIEQKDLTATLRRVYQQSDKSPHVAQTIAELLEPADAVQLLSEHIAVRPADSAVFEALIHVILSDDGAVPASDRVPRAVEVTASTIRSLSATAERYADILIQASGDIDVILDVFEGPDAQPDPGPVMHYLHGVLLSRAKRNDEALEHFTAALSVMPQLDTARLANARLLVDAGRWAEAEELIEPLVRQDHLDAVGLRVRIMVHTDQTKEALQLIDRVIDRHPLNLHMAIQKSSLQIVLGDYDGAELMLRNQLRTHPNAEPLYDALFNLYDGYKVSNRQVQYARLRDHLARQMPNSWLGRLMKAELMVAADKKQAAQAANELIQLMRERPTDYRALDRYLDLLWTIDRQDKANALIDQRIAAAPDDIALLNQGLKHYVRRDEDRQKLQHIYVMKLLIQPPSESRAHELAEQYNDLDQSEKAVEAVGTYLDDDLKNPVAMVRQLRLALTQIGRLEEAVQRINRAVEKFDEHQADLMYELAMLYEGFADPLKSEQVMIDILDNFPDHVDTNNGLGYRWADCGVHLDRAEAMIKKALAAKPDSAHIRDSLGWVYYKQGRFEQAAAELRRAIEQQYGDHIVILNHLGDALYRLGDHDAAAKFWQRARTKFDSEEVKLSPEIEGLDDRIDRKLEATRNNQTPNIAEVPKPAPTQPVTKPST